MDRVAIISDIHGNITALESVIKDIRSRHIDKIYCLGDLIYKGCNPDLTIDLVRKECDVIIKGNCDESICNLDSLRNKAWSRRKIGDERANYVAKLPIFYEFYMSGYLIRLFHASPFALDYMYNPMFSNKNTRYSATELKSALNLFENTSFLGKSDSDPIPDIVGYGHTHTPSIFRIKNKTVFNPGSVGMPIEMLNDNVDDKTNKFSTLSSYMILEGNLEKKELGPISFQLVRLPYDIEKEVRFLEASDMPNKDRTIKELRSATNC